jgi:hypothetical protein
MWFHRHALQLEFDSCLQAGIQTDIDQQKWLLEMMMLLLLPQGSSHNVNIWRL